MSKNVPGKQYIEASPELSSSQPDVESNKPKKSLLVDDSNLECFGYVFYKETNGNFSTIRVNFSDDLTDVDFSNKEFAGTDKQIAIERLKIKLGENVF